MMSIKAGKARYIGASSMYAWQFAKALYLADAHGWTRFVSMQNHYNLLYREEEREMMPLCLEEQIAVIPWSPLARGRLTRPWSEKDATKRAAGDEFGKTLYAQTEDADRLVVDRVNDVAAEPRYSRSASGAGVDVEQAVRHGADHRCDKAAPFAGCICRGGARNCLPARNRETRRTVRAASGPRL